jgi:hypothetical protein
MEPDNLLCSRCIFIIFFSIAVCDGIGPYKLFQLRFRSCRFSIVIIESGIAPENWFFERSSTLRPVKFEIVAGSSPSKLVSDAMKVSS